MKHKSLQTLIEAARKAHQPEAPPAPETAPLGFSARVTAQAFGAPPGLHGLALFERVSWFGAACSAAICLVAFALHTRQPEPNPFDALLDDQPAYIQTR